jgi:hypothetical protein
MLTSELGALGAPSQAGATMPQGAGMPLASLTAPPAVAQVLMILGGGLRRCTLSRCLFCSWDGEAAAPRIQGHLHSEG